MYGIEELKRSFSKLESGNFSKENIDEFVGILNEIAPHTASGVLIKQFSIGSAIKHHNIELTENQVRNHKTIAQLVKKYAENKFISFLGADVEKIKSCDMEKLANDSDYFIKKSADILDKDKIVRSFNMLESGKFSEQNKANFIHTVNNTENNVACTKLRKLFFPDGVTTNSNTGLSVSQISQHKRIAEVLEKNATQKLIRWLGEEVNENKIDALDSDKNNSSKKIRLELTL
jgi:hypothetical protein